MSNNNQLTPVTRGVFLEYATKHGSRDNTYHTGTHTTMEYFNSKGEVVAVAEYDRDKSWPCKRIYRIARQ